MRKDWSHDVVELSDDPVVHWVEAALLVWRAHDQRAISSVEVRLKMSSDSTSRWRPNGRWWSVGTGSADGLVLFIEEGGKLFGSVRRA
jgi:hypothetical protein